ncbi:MAG: ABC transporter ATP-binding protein [Planctomycetota bacterium]|nr:ABC transporter ATP-binding protein [Planctomycetota bacterium]
MLGQPPQPVPQPAPQPAPQPPQPDRSNFVVYFDGVTKVFRDQRTGKEHVAIKDVDFAVEDLPDKGEFIAVLGPSGCGKSTVLKIIAGLEPQWPQTSGTVLVKGRPVTCPGPDRGMVFQSYSSYPCYNVLDNVAFGLELQGIPREERRAVAAEWIKKVRLAGAESKYPNELSGGMQQRVALARTLAVKPKIILMDEPFGALDRTTRWEMQDLLVQLWREVQATVFLVTHDIAEAVYLGDRIYIMSGSPGTIIEEVRVPSPSGKAAEQQRTVEFSAIVNEISRKVEKAR